MTMTAEAQWHSTRWRDARDTPRFDGLQHHPPLSGLHTPHPLSKDSSTHAWYGTPPDQARPVPHDSPHPGQYYAAPPSQPDRSAQSSSQGPSTQSYFPPAAGQSGSWRSDAAPARHPSDKRPSDVPLSLQIPNTASALPSIAAHGYATPRSDAPVYSGGTSSWSHQTTSLPSFAALSEQTTRADEPDEVEIAPMSARLPCANCAKLRPLIQDVASAVAELDGSVQSVCSVGDSRSLNVPNESAMRTLQWILDRMRYTNYDMQGLARRSGTDQGRQPSTNPLKRSAEQWDQDDMPTLKLPRPDGTNLDERRSSVDYAARDHLPRSAYSPAPSDSAPGSAYPRHGSPGRLPRGLPSPSSLAFQQSAGASFQPANTASIGSPGTSYHAASSIHTVSTNSATSAHLQDLQHQVSLKSLALQTLQTEYATLLQKLQRERIKSQTIEKKTTVADQEVNDLTTKNEELSEQVKMLEAQLQESERKRESERADTAKEKEQWSRMLDMSNRLQNKSASDYQRVAKEKANLAQRLAAYETSPSHTKPSLSAQDGRLSPSDATRMGSSPISHPTPSDGDALRRENATLSGEMSRMRANLDELSREYIALEECMEQVTARKAGLREAMERATGWKPRGGHEADKASAPPVTPAPPAPEPARHHPSPATQLPPMDTHSARPPPPPSNPHDPFSRENLAHIARAVSPGPAELGFHVQPSTSSPEELIRALGPVPAPLPRHEPSFPTYPRRQSQPFIAPLAEAAPLAAFRPLDRAATPRSDGSSPARSPDQHTQQQQYAERRHSQPQVSRSPSAAAMPPPPRPVS